MFGIAPSKVLSDLVIGVCPEALQVVGDLHGPVVGSEKMQKHGDASAGHARGLGPAEKFLKADGEDWRLPGLVGQAGLFTARQRERLVRALAMRGPGLG